jgi:putative sigma-54 modulation protein
MKIQILERNEYKASAKLKKVVEDKMKKLDKYFDKSASAKIICSKNGKQEKLEITIKSNGLLYRSEVVSDSMFANIDYALPKLETQIVRNREKLIDKRKSRAVKEMVSEPFEFLEEEPDELPKVFKKKSFELEPILIDDARLAIERLGHDFYAFLNAKTGKINIIYRRKDNKFGLIELKY